MKRLTTAAACVALLGVLLACAGPATQAKVRTREELTKALMDKSPEEVRALLGKPVATIDLPDATAWQYEGISRDPVSGKVDGLTFVDVSKKTGRVVKVDCRP